MKRTTVGSRSTFGRNRFNALFAASATPEGIEAANMICKGQLTTGLCPLPSLQRWWRNPKKSRRF